MEGMDLAIYTANAMVADVPLMLGARASAAVVLV